MIEKERLAQIVAAMESKNAKLPCSRCGHKAFEVVAESYTPIQSNPNTFAIGGPTLPSVIIACANCGHIWTHALGPLGLTPQGAV